VALGVSAYSAAVFHLMTHAFFKALLFLAAGSVIIGMHHEQDMRKMGGLKKYMPITFWTILIGTLALVGTPFLSGFYSKDTIIEAAQHAAHNGNWINTYAYAAVLLGVFVTSFYSFRLLYLTFFGKERFDTSVAHHAPSHDEHPSNHDEHHHDHHDDHHHGGLPHESPWVVTVPLILLAIPSIFIGFFTIGPMLFGNYFAGAIEVLPQNDVIKFLGEEFHGPVAFALHGMTQWPFFLALAGFALATYIYLFNIQVAERSQKLFAWPIRILENKYGFDDLWIKGFAGGGVALGKKAWTVIDAGLIDGVLVNGTARLVGRVSRMIRGMQTGYLYTYAFAMIVGLIVLLAMVARLFAQ
ncbi:MAG: NADH-quinone oxidoreductase subunit L, partial [Arenimonas sp.]|nr:NADH-quinone oxidoreductase subunit L [Arenimonas sp.]